jgi:regulator of sirC expression with transglutaminase-like and TPR domain
VIRESWVRAFSTAALSPDPDLAVAALMIARIAYPHLDAGPYLDRLDAIGHEARRRVAAAPVDAADTPAGVDPESYGRVMALNDYLFGELCFVGNDAQYEDPRNSFLNEVLDRRTGIPISLALVYIEIARRAGIHAEGVNFPGHFLVRCPARGGTLSRDLIIDAHHRGALLSEDACRQMIRRHAPDAEPDDARLFARAAKPQIMIRMLLNLKHQYLRLHSFPQARDVMDLLLAVDPSAIHELRDRGLLSSQLNDLSGALRDLQAYLRLSAGAPVDEERRDEQASIWEHVKALRKRIASLN